MDTHVRVAAWLRILGSAFYLLLALVVLLIFGGVAAGVSGDREALHAASWIAVAGTFVSLFFAALALPGLVTGWGLLTYRPWARIVDIVLSAFDLVHVPIGTAIGGYSLWVMFHPETVEMFESRPSGRYPAHF